MEIPSTSSAASSCADFLSVFLTGLTPVSKSSIYYVRRLIEQSSPLISDNFIPTPPFELLAALSLSDRHTYDVFHSPLNGYCLLYVSDGHGFIESPFLGNVPLKSRSLCFFPLSEGYRISFNNETWKLYSLFLDGPSTSYYYELFSSICRDVFVTPPSSLFSSFLTDFWMSYPKHRHDPVWITEFFTSIFSLLIRDVRAFSDPSGSNVIPSYLVSIRNSFHSDCSAFVSLSMLEQTYHISRFRISHEFTVAFGKPPITYLNQLRLKKACTMLTQSDDRVGEISMSVGFESVNHFINLFRREYGMTPGAYRKAYKNQHINIFLPFKKDL